MRGGKLRGTAQIDRLMTVWGMHHVSKNISFPYRSSGAPPVNPLSSKCIISVLNNIGVFRHKTAQIKNVVQIQILT